MDLLFFLSNLYPVVLCYSDYLADMLNTPLSILFPTPTFCPTYQVVSLLKPNQPSAYLLCTHTSAAECSWRKKRIRKVFLIPLHLFPSMSRGFSNIVVCLYPLIPSVLKERWLYLRGQLKGVIGSISLVPLGIWLPAGSVSSLSLVLWCCGRGLTL